MSRSVDERVVQMEFDNEQFERETKRTMQTLDQLQNKLNFDDSVDSISKLTSNIGKVSFDPITNGLTVVGKGFSAMEVIGITALQNITNQAVNTGKQLVSSLTVDNIAEGWNKFAEKTTAVGTLISQGYDMSVVEDQLNRLNFFTDETSYKFNDMVSTIAKFTASGKGLEESVTAIEGIANWAALSGVGATKASSAMYQLSQAMSSFMKKEDWKSIQNLNMDTAEFRQKALDAAVALGTLRKNADGTYRSLVATKNVTDFTVSEFVDHLTADAWFTSDVMLKVFNDYSSAVDDIYRYTVENGVTASEAIEQLDGQIDEFGLKAFRAAQEARTFTDAIDSVKEAVQSGWSTTFEKIFGNYEESKVLWTDLANSLYDMFAEGGNLRNLMLTFWKEAGGREDLIDGVYAIGRAISNIIETVKAGIQIVFPYISITEDNLEIMAERFSNFTLNVKKFGLILEYLTEQGVGPLGKAVVTAASVVDILNTALYKIAYVATYIVATAINALNIDIWGIADAVSNAIIKFDAWFKNDDSYIAIAVNLGNAIGYIASAIHTLLSSDFVKNGLSTLLGGVLFVFSVLIENIAAAAEGLNEFINYILTLDGLSFANIANGFNAFVTKVLGKLVNLNKIFGNITLGIDNFGNKILEFGKSILEHFGLQLEGITTQVKTFGEFLSNAASMIWQFIRNINPASVALFAIAVMFLKITNVVSAAADSLWAVEGIFRNLKNYLMLKNITQIVAVIGMLSGSILLIVQAIKQLAEIPTQDLVKAGITVGTLSAVLLGFTAIITQFKGFDIQIKGLASTVLMFAAAVAIIASVVKSFMSLADEDLDANKVELLVNNIVKVVLALGAAMSGIALVSTFGAEGSNMKGSGFAILAMAASLKIIAWSINDLYNSIKDFNIQDWGRFVALFGTLLLALGGLAVIMKLATMKSNIAMGLIGKAFTKHLSGTVGVSGTHRSNNLGWSVLMLVASLKVLAIGINDLNAAADSIKKVEDYIPLFEVIGALCVAMRIAGPSAAKAGIGLALIMGSLFMLKPLVASIASLKMEEIKKAKNSITSFGVMFAALVLVSKFAGENAKAAGIMLVEASIALGAISLVMHVLSDLSVAEIKKATIAIDSLLLCFAAVIAASKRAREVKLQTVIMVAAIAELVGAIWLLKDTPWETVAVVTGAIESLLAVMAIVSHAMGKMDAGAETGMAIITGVMFGLGAIIIAMSNWVGPLESVIASVGGITILMGTMLATAEIMKLIGNVNISPGYAVVELLIGANALILGAFLQLVDGDKIDRAIEASASMLILLGGVAALTFALNAISGIPIIGVLKGALLLFTGLAAVGIAGAEAIAIGFVLVAEMMALATLLGELADYLNGESSNLEKGFEILTNFAHSLGVVVGAFAGGVTVALAADLVAVGTGLENFANSVMVLVNTIKESTFALPDVTDFISFLSEMPSAITQFSMLGSGGGINWDNVNANIISMGEALKSFYQSTSDIPWSDGVVGDAMAAFIALGGLDDSLPKKGGIFEYWFGSSDATGFADGMDRLGTSMKTLYNKVKDVKDWGPVETFSRKVSLLADIETSLAKHGGNWQNFIGDATFQSFVEGLLGKEGDEGFVGLVPAMIELNKQAKTVTDWKPLNRLVTAAQDFVDLEEKLTPHAGFDIVTGKGTLSEYAAGIQDLGVALGELNEIAKGIEDEDKIDNALNVIQKIINFDFGDVGFVKSSYSDVDKQLSDSPIKFSGALGLFQRGLYTAEAVLTDARNGGSASTGINNLKSKIKAITTALKELADGINDIPTDISFTHVDALLSELKKFVDLSNIVNLDNIENTYTSVRKLGESLYWFSYNIGQIDSVDFDAKLKSVNEVLYAIYTAATNYGGDSLNGFITNIWKFSTTLKTLQEIDATPGTFMTKGTVIISGIVEGIRQASEQASVQDIIKNSLFTMLNNTITQMDAHFSNIGASIMSKVKLGIAGHAVENMTTPLNDALNSDEFAEFKSNMYRTFFDFGSYITAGLANGMVVKAQNYLYPSVNVMCGQMSSIIEKRMGIASPSKVTKQYGLYIAQGLAIGINNGAKKELYPAMSTMCSTMDNIVRDFWQMHSPPQRAIDEGYGLTGGYAIGVEEGAEKELYPAIDDIKKRARDRAKENAEEIGEETGESIFDSLMNYLDGVIPSGISDQVKGFFGGIIDGISDAFGLDSNDILGSIMENLGMNNFSDAMMDKIDDLTSQMTEGLTSGMGAALGSMASTVSIDTSLEDAYSAKIDEINAMFATRLGNIDTITSIANAEYSLWQALNPNATDQQTYYAQQAMYNRSINLQADKVDQLRQKWEALNAEFGAEDENVINAYLEYVNAATSLANERNNLQNLIDQNGTETQQTTDSIVEEITQLMNVRSMFASDPENLAKINSMIEQKKKQITQGTKKVQNTAITNADNALSVVSNTIKDTALNTVEEAGTIFSDYGAENIQGYADAIKDMTPYVGEATTEVTTTVNTTLDDNVDSVYDYGASYDDALAEGIYDNSSVVSDAVQSVVDNALSGYTYSGTGSSSGYSTTGTSSGYQTFAQQIMSMTEKERQKYYDDLSRSKEVWQSINGETEDFEERIAVMLGEFGMTIEDIGHASDSFMTNASGLAEAIYFGAHNLPVNNYGLWGNELKNIASFDQYKATAAYAIIQSQNPDLTPREIMQEIINNVRDSGGQNYHGYSPVSTDDVYMEFESTFEDQLYTSNQQVDLLNNINDTLQSYAKANTATSNTTNNYNFNQTNNSPEALDALTIYRQTSNQFSAFKSATSGVGVYG